MAGALVLAIWMYLLLFRGRFWRMRDESRGGPASSCTPRVVAIVPARDEAATVGEAVRSLAAQQYAGGFHVIVVDDQSSDGTAAVAHAAAPPEKLSVVAGPPLPPGWTGKLWALHVGLSVAEQHAPDYLLLTDADVVHPPDAVATLVARAEAGACDLVSYMVTLSCATAAERALIPAFVFFFFLLYPPAWIRDHRYATAGAAGGCVLVRRGALESMGGLAAIRGELIDDCALARAVKQAGGRVWLGLSGQAHSVRQYAGWGEIGRMIARTAFTQLNHSVFLLAGALAGLAVTYLAPPVLALTGSWTGGAAWLLMAAAYVPALRFYRRSLLWAPLLPLVAAFYMGATVYSAVAYWRGAGGQWKGRVQAVR